MADTSTITTNHKSEGWRWPHIVKTFLLTNDLPNWYSGAVFGEEYQAVKYFRYQWESREDMRQHLIDTARARRKEEVVSFEQLEDSLPTDFDNLELLVNVGRLLDQPAETNPNWSLVVELKYFLGFTDKETAATMGIKLRTVQRMWAGARAWLFDRAGSLRYRTGSKTTSESTRLT